MLEKLIPGLNWWKLLALGLVIAGIFGAGYYRGSQGRYQTGFDAGVKSTEKQTKELKDQVSSLTTKINDGALAKNRRISELETQAASLNAENSKLKQANTTARTKAVDDYLKKNPQTQHSCGWTSSSVEAINLILDGVSK